MLFAMAAIISLGVTGALADQTADDTLIPADQPVVSQSSDTEETAPGTAGLGLVLLGAAIAVFMAGAGSSIGLFHAGQTMAGALREKPEMFGRLFPIAVLPGTQGLYGFLIGFLLLQWSGVISGAPKAFTTWQGLMALGAALPVGLSGFFSGIYQGKVCSSSISLTARRPEQLGKAIVLGVLVEVYAVLGLLISFLALNQIMKLGV